MILTEILPQRCFFYWQSKCQTAVKSADANNSYSGFLRSLQNVKCPVLSNRTDMWA